MPWSDSLGLQAQNQYLRNLISTYEEEIGNQWIVRGISTYLIRNQGRENAHKGPGFLHLGFSLYDKYSAIEKLLAHIISYRRNPINTINDLDHLMQIAHEILTPKEQGALANGSLYREISLAALAQLPNMGNSFDQSALDTGTFHYRSEEPFVPTLFLVKWVQVFGKHNQISQLELQLHLGKN